MKYNKKEVMKKAWEIFRKTTITFSEALKMAWKLVKGIAELKARDYEEDGIVTVKLWFNYGKARAYVTRNWVSKFQNNKGYYIDLITGLIRL